MDNQNDTNYYDAQPNLNTSMENPSIDVDDVLDQNVQGVNNQDFSVPDSSAIRVSVSGNTSDHVYLDKSDNEQYVPNMSSDEVSYQPTIDSDKKNDNGKIIISKELKIMFFIVLILFIFILFMPYIYNIFEKLHLVIVNR